MEQFRRDIESSDDTPVPFTISVGVSKYTGDFSKTIQNVDHALYKATTDSVAILLKQETAVFMERMNKVNP